MATISSTESIPNPGFNPWPSKVDLDTNTGSQTVFVYGGSGTLLYTGTPQEVISTIPKLAGYAADQAFFDSVISTILSQSQSLAAQYSQLVPPVPTEPLPPITDTKTSSNNLTGSADGDAVGNPGSTPSGAANGVSTSTANPPYSVSQQNQGAALATSSSGSTTPTTTSQPTGNSPPKPGRRLQNPLGDFSSYTYQLSLYMVTPEGYKAFAGTGRKDINVLKGQAKPQIVTLIQSGGINNTTNTRASGFELDFYIDDLSFKTTTSPKGTSSQLI